MKHQQQAICFGEVLWDILPEGAVPGGAPMNVAYHLNKLSKPTSIISKIGDDENGNKLVGFLKKYNVSTELIQVDQQHETGTVLATHGENNEMHYDIVKPVAYDFIDLSNQLKEKVAVAPVFIFGSLAARSEHSRNTLLQLIDAAQTKVLDINLRPPHYEKHVVENLLDKATILKLNNNELDILCDWLGYSTSSFE